MTMGESFRDKQAKANWPSQGTDPGLAGHEYGCAVEGGATMKFTGDRTDVTALVMYAQSLETDTERLRSVLKAVIEDVGDKMSGFVWSRAMHAIGEERIFRDDKPTS